MKAKTRVVLFIAAVATLAAGCGRSESTPSAAPAAPAAPAAADTESATIAVKVGTTALGDVLVDPKGLTLYAFTNDIDARSSCTNKCAEAWPPLVVPANWDVGPGLDSGVFATTTRDDGRFQLVAGRFPLYTFAADAAPGDTKGQGSGDVWFAINAKGQLVKNAAATPPAQGAPSTTIGGARPPTQPAPAPAPAPPTTSAKAPVSVASNKLGQLLVDGNGLTLYGFTKDTDGSPTCDKACADAWPPAIVSGEQLPAGLDAKVFSVVKRPDGRNQLKAGKWPLYRFAGDAAPGETNGQGSGGVWFAVNPTGGLIR